MALEYVTANLKSLPSAANGVSVTPSITAFANSSYTQITSSMGNAATLAALIYNPGTSSVEVEVDIATGASGSEVVIATFRFVVGASATTSDPFCYVPLPIAVANIASGNRVAIRMRKTGSSTTAWDFAILYYDNTPSGITTTTTIPAALPSAAAGASITTGTSKWTNTAYSQIRSASGGAVYLAGVALLDATNEEIEVDIATGTAGSEVVQTTVRFSINSAGPVFFPLRQLLDQFPASTRIAARLRHGTTTSVTARVSIQVYPKPL